VVKSLIEWLLRIAVGGVFIYAGVLKARDTQQFALDVQNFQLTSWTASIVVAVYLPWVEILAALALILRRLYSGAIVALGGMTVVFLVAIISAWTRGLDISCGCFGKSEVAVSYPEMLGRDVALLAAIVALGWIECGRAHTPPASAAPPLTSPDTVKS
jgi:putative oxidoreductase